MLTLTFSLPGPPLTEATTLEVLLQHGVTVALGVDENYQPAHTRFEAAWVGVIRFLFLSSNRSADGTNP